MKQYKLICVYGFAIFAMFFGSGNLVFPLHLGQQVGKNWFLGFLGLFVTGIVLPFLGLFVIKLHKGNYRSFFAEGGKVAGLILPLFTLSLLGSFGVVPRCITVAHGGMDYLFPGLSLTMFSLIFCGLTYILCLKDNIMIDLIGKFISPIKLTALGILIVVGIIYSPQISSEKPAISAFSDGVFMGYQTMDLFAAFFFSSLIFNRIKSILPETNDNRIIIKAALSPSIAGALMLAIVYLGFVFLGAHYGDLIQNVEPELMLPTIATYALNPSAAFIIGIAIIVSCLTTAVALNNIYARYLVDTLKLKPSYFPIMLAGTTAISFFISLLDFKGIAAFLAPALEVSYPGLIALTILSIFIKDRKILKMSVFYTITVIMIAIKIME
ncbi:branched-chain amino acid transport system II carrier protein [Candidatus Bodocaedibacter vickermanii]|uniref:Branched-chain amino acid transport system carrier protein n=1 Tax=Candidatus Bodocaedibacter vickermanii TaxID=2741701 RepID=A0A7L9RSM6_9PROT|nr:Branched-chain amino acid transport system 2 carrier protein [Candidatus Paracaedibacteraceae bacterium 'Lake Konstanz']